MTRKSPTIQQGKVMELMAQLSKLPEREKAPSDPASLSEIFRAKEYAAEIRGALKRGYSFGDLAEIFTEKCGIVISERQIRYHYTRGKNQGTKGKSGKKAGEGGAAEKPGSSGDSAQNGAADGGKGNPDVTDSEAKSSSEHAGVVFDSGVADGDAKPGDFSLGR